MAGAKARALSSALVFLLSAPVSAQMLDTSAEDSNTALTCIFGGSPDADETIAACTKLIASGQLDADRPELAEIYGRRGDLYLDRGRNAQALTDFDKEIELNPTSEYAYADRGEYFFRVKEYERALDDYKTAVKLNPRNADTLYIQGVIKTKLGDTSGGDADIAKAKEMNAAVVANAAVAGFAP